MEEHVPTIFDVAWRADTSITTVSRALSGKRPVSEGTRRGAWESL
ncbi:LacI family DNA-binding transcriptional regulator [Dictyobacter halimunensis]